MELKIGHREWFVFIVTIILLTDLAILLDIPYLRQISGFVFLTILPGLLILQILKLNKIGPIEKFVLSVGLSISFLMFFVLFINNLSLSLGYLTPLSTTSLLITFNIAFIIFAIIGYKLNKDLIFSLPNLNLSTAEKAFLIVPILFPALSIFGMHVMNTTDNNIILMFFLFLISIYVAFVCFFNQKFSKRLYPVVIFLISISLLLLLALRSNHIIGVDTHSEYYLFRTTLDNLHWHVFILGGPLDACLCISILPTIYQSILNVSPEFLFKVFYSLFYSISPIVVYVLSKKYIGESYGFLASCFFMFQSNFLLTELHARTNTAILFFALAMMVLVNDRIDPLKRRVLFIVFMASCMVSHYSTTYIFFFIMLGAFVGMEILSKKYTVKKAISLTIVLLFFALIFCWYSQVTETPFNAGVGLIETTFINLNQFFVEESRGESVYAMFGEEIMQKGIPHKIQFVWTWLTFAFIGIGIITLIKRYKGMSFPELRFKKADFLKEKFEVVYFTITLGCLGLLVVTIALPFVSVGYAMERLYTLAIVILSPFFVIGGVVLSKQTFKNHFFFLRKRKPVLKEKNGSQVRAYLIILLVLIPYFFCVTGVMYNMFGIPRAIILNSEGEQYEQMYVYDQDSYGARWLGSHKSDMKTYTDYFGGEILCSQGKGRIPYRLSDRTSLFKNRKIDGYIYLRYYNVVDGKLWVSIRGGLQGNHNTSDYADIFIEKSKIYANGGSEIYR